MLKAAFDQFADPSIVIGMKTMLDAPPSRARRSRRSMKMPNASRRGVEDLFRAAAFVGRAKQQHAALSESRQSEVLTSIAPQLRELKVPP